MTNGEASKFETDADEDRERQRLRFLARQIRDPEHLQAVLDGVQAGPMREGVRKLLLPHLRFTVDTEPTADD
jgi:hypothetical protein